MPTPSMPIHLRRSAGAACALLLALAALIAAPAGRTSAATPALQVGVGQADITPVTGGFKGGWACSCAKALGQHTRLYAHAVVLQRGTQKVALVTEDLAFLGAGMIRDAASLLPGRGFSESNIIDSATHTHGSQSGFMNFGSYNSVLPSTGNPLQGKIVDTATDQTMYNFMTRQLAAAIAQADDSLAPGEVGWGRTTLSGLTQNRSLEAHLADYGIDEPPGTGSVSQDPHGYAGTIDPAVDLLRVDRLVDGHTAPIGVWTTFANHGTVDKENFSYFTADHQGAAERTLADAIRQAAGLAGSATVVTAFANSDAGDQSSGLTYSGPADAEYVGRREAQAMLVAWRDAGSHLTATPTLALSWTRQCMCGQSADGHATSSTPVLGLAQAAGSEEGRTVFSDLGLAHEGDRLPVDAGTQGRKIPALTEQGNIPAAVPLTALRIDDHLVVTWPGEPTLGVGNMVRSAVSAATASAGIKQVVLAGYAGEYVDYWTTPQEYEAQHYEGGSTVYGEYASVLVKNEIVDLATRLVRGRAAPTAYAYDPNNGVHVTDAAYGSGAATAMVTAQPSTSARLGHPAFAWTGGADGLDRPVDRAFVSVQRSVSGSWQPVTDDLGLQVLWSVDSSGHYVAQWEVPPSAATGSYRFVVTAKNYTLTSTPFTVTPASTLTPVVSGGTVTLRNPAARVNADWTYRPAVVTGPDVTFVVDGRRVEEKSAGSSVAVPSGTSVVVPAGGARDPWGNSNATAVTVR